KPYVADEARPQVSSYAQGEDYHTTARKILADLMEEINHHELTVKMRPFADSAPVMERNWAEEAGLGWIGKNSCLIRPDCGSAFFIAGFLTDQLLHRVSDQGRNYCGSCSACISHCPVSAIKVDDGIDARKCLSAWTIEYKDKIPAEIAERMENRLFGCDICQQVCPWNKKHLEESNPGENSCFEKTSEDWL
ncbi:MAG: tRNA epoxyqueuosine(34) reductase QueG, partial [Proteobacteria bacterium]|nr:tRNA epoxyqueuosine(34) reductase QueG [Pseudomonadota bacterium]